MTSTPIAAVQMRESIPLFCAGVSDSVAMTFTRESISSVEPYGRGASSAAACGSSSGVAASTRPAEFMASVMTLDTLHEEASFMDDLPAKPAGALHMGTLTPKSAAKAAERARQVAESAGFGDEQLFDLPNDLPDPTFAPSAAMTPVPAAAPASSHTTAAASPAMSDISLKEATSARSRGVYSGAKGKAPTSTAKKEAVMSTPLLRLAADASASPRIGGKPIVSTVRKLMGTPAGPTTSRPGSTLPSTSKPLGRLAGPSSGIKGPGQHTPAGAVGGIKGLGMHTPAAAAGHVSGIKGHGLRTPSTAAKPVSLAPAGTPAAAGRAAASPAFVATPASVATPTLMPAAAAQARAGPAAVMPNMPASWNTPLAQMQQLPMDFAVSACMCTVNAMHPHVVL